MNHVTEKADCYISYRRNDDALDAMFVMIAGVAGEAKHLAADETAICKDGKYYILNGDWRKEFASCETFDECMKIFRANQDKRSDWSNVELN